MQSDSDLLTANYFCGQGGFVIEMRPAFVSESMARRRTKHARSDALWWLMAVQLAGLRPQTRKLDEPGRFGYNSSKMALGAQPGQILRESRHCQQFILRASGIFSVMFHDVQ